MSCNPRFFLGKGGGKTTSIEETTELSVLSFGFDPDANWNSNTTICWKLLLYGSTRRRNWNYLAILAL